MLSSSKQIVPSRNKMNSTVLGLVLQRVDTVTRSVLLQQLSKQQRRESKEQDPFLELTTAISQGRVDVVKRLLQQHPDLLEDARVVLMELDRPEAIDVLVQLGLSTSELLVESIRSRAVGVAIKLLASRSTNIGLRDNEPVRLAIEAELSDLVTRLVSDRRFIMSESVLLSAALSNNETILDAVIARAGNRRPSSIVASLILTAACHLGNLEAAQISIAVWKAVPTTDNFSEAVIGEYDKIVKLIGESVPTAVIAAATQHHLSRAKEYRMKQEMIDLLVRLPEVDLDQLASEEGTLEYIVRKLDKLISEHVSMSIHLSSDLFSRDQVLDLISHSDGSLYVQLLRELIVKRLGLEYYIDWLMRELSKPTHSNHTKRDVIDAIDRVHSSSISTALDGLFRVGRTATLQHALNILSKLSQARDVNTEGLQLAGGLIGALIGSGSVTKSTASVRVQGTRK